MNKSERIRSLISLPKTAAEIHIHLPKVSIQLIRGCIQTMVQVGLVNRLADKKPYTYQVARSLKQQNRGFDLSKVSFAQQIRDILKNGPKTSKEITAILGSDGIKVGYALRECLNRAQVSRTEDGLFEFICDPVVPEKMSKEERRNRQAEYRKRKAEEEGREYKAIPTRRRKESANNQYTAIKPKNVVDLSGHQTVEEWVKAGGVIDRSPTIPKFERLKEGDIFEVRYKKGTSYPSTSSRAYTAS